MKTLTVGEILSVLPDPVAKLVIEVAESGGETQFIHQRLHELVAPYGKELAGIGLIPEYTACALTLASLQARVEVMNDLAECAPQINTSLN
jgi:hypothetical protein